MLFRAIAGAVLVVVLAPAQVLLNQPKDSSVIRVDVDLVNVLCTVRDHNGAYAKGLERGDFEIRDDGAPQEIRHFAREVDTPLTVALLLDVSSSVDRVLSDEKNAAARFFREVLRRGDRAMLVGFAGAVNVWQDLTGSAAELDAALRAAGRLALRISPGGIVRGGTVLFDAVTLVSERKLAGLPGRRTIILISDGRENGSEARLTDAVKAAQAADAIIYGIHYEDAAFGTSGRDVLARLAEPTGGRTFHLNRYALLEPIFAAISEEMRNQYALAYRLPHTDKRGAFHRIAVKVRKPGLKVQTRNGYYSQKR